MSEQHNNSYKRTKNSEQYDCEPFAKNWKDFWLIICGAMGGILVSVIIKLMF